MIFQKNGCFVILRFGVCCIFLVSASGGIISQNCTYIRNPGFPSAYSGTGSVSYTIQKCSSDVCWLRLDFESFQILGPSSTSEPSGGSCPDTFVMTVRWHFLYLIFLVFIAGILKLFRLVDVFAWQDWLYFITQTSTTPSTLLPTICGTNAGQHGEEKIIT